LLADIIQGSQNRRIAPRNGYCTLIKRLLWLFVAMSQRPYLIIRKIEIAAGELATPPEAFIAGPLRSPPQPGSVEWQQQQKAAFIG
jgi:hypothetical protein